VLYLKRFLFKFLSSCLLSCRFFHFIFCILYLAIYMQIQSGCKGILYSGSKKHKKLKPALETGQKTRRRKKRQKMGETRKCFLNKSIFLKGKRGITTVYFWFFTNAVYKPVPLHIFLEDIYTQDAGTPFSQQIVPCKTRKHDR